MEPTNRHERRLAKKRGTSPQNLAIKSSGIETPQAMYEHALARYQQGDLVDADAICRRGLKMEPHHAENLHLLGVIAHQRGDYETAIDWIGRAIRINRDIPAYHHNLGLALQAQGKLDAAVASYQRTIVLEPVFFQAHHSLGLALQAQGKLDAAVASYQRAISLEPNFAIAILNRANALQAQGNLEEAAACLAGLLAKYPDFAEAHMNLGLVLSDQGKREEAFVAYRRAIALKPNLAEPHRALANGLRLEGRIDDAFEEYRNYAALQLRKNAPSAMPARAAAAHKHKLKHDHEQFAYLLDLKKNDAAFREIEAAIASDPNRFDPLFENLFHIEGGARIEAGAVNPNLDVTVLESDWKAREPKIVVIDDFLTPDALEELRRFCWGSTTWKTPYANGYIGTFLADGFACPLLAQIATELKAKFTNIVGDHKLIELWGFKYDNELRGINVHADIAAVNVNFWITPDDANLDPTSGGLVIWDKPAPLDWAFQKFQGNPQGIADFLARNHASSTTVPYRCNRAVVFDSDLFHETDRFTFKEDYRNRRINITLLYGLRHEAMN